MHSNKQGNGLFVVLIILTALAFGVYSVSKLINGERRLNAGSVAYNEAKQAAESLIQSSTEGLITNIANSANINPNVVSGTIPISAVWLAFYSGNASASNIVTGSLQVLGGSVQGPNWVTINPLEPGYENDNARDTRVFMRSIEFIARATVNNPSLGPITAYVSQNLAIRDIPLFAYAIFYNLPMEFAPGQDMVVYRNVHGNGSVWVQSNQGLDFRGVVTTAGDFFHGTRNESGKNETNADVRIINNLGNFVNMKNDGDGMWPTPLPTPGYSEQWLQSADGQEGGNADNNFAETALQVWTGNLKTREHDVPVLNLPGVSDYVEDTDGNINNGKQSFNSAYPIIQPVLNPSPPVDSNLEAVERQKFAYKANLTIEVDTNTNTLSYFTYVRDQDDNLVYINGAPAETPLIPPNIIETDGTVRTFANIRAYSEDSGGNVSGGLYDHRHQQGINIVELDIEMLKDIIHAADDITVNNLNPFAIWGVNNNQRPTVWWNGIVYVQFPQANASPSRTDNVNPAADTNWGVKLINGTTIPNPSYAGNKIGMTLATNQMMYVHGNYNADGTITNNSPTDSDDPARFAIEGEEAPAALVADAINFLSNNWVDANSKPTALSGRTVATPSEISAAIMTGVVPSGKYGTGTYSGGVENLPRFLENWNSTVCAIRGSMVVLYESEVANETWSFGAPIYKAPTRNWGFHTEFGEGRLPPGTPFIRGYRGSLRTITEDEYNSWF